MDNLREIRERLASLPAMEQRQQTLKDNLRIAQEDLLSVLAKYEKETRDLERIENNSFSAFVYQLFDQYERKVEKEQREAVYAKLAYDGACVRVQALKQEKAELEARISALRQDAHDYEHALSQRRERLLQSLSMPERAVFQRLEENGRAIMTQVAEIKEALDALARAEATAADALDSLEGADSCATFDVWTRGGIITDMAKYAYVDKAEESFHRLHSQLRDLRHELGDVHGISVPAFNTISSGQRMVDFWFDNIFTDLSVRADIRANIDLIENLLRQLHNVKHELNSKMNEASQQLKQNRRQEEEILLSLDNWRRS